MARGPRSPAPPERKELTPEQMRAGSERLRQRIVDLEALDLQAINSGSDPAIQALQRRIEGTVAQVFGPGTHEYMGLRLAWQLDATQYTMRVDLMWSGGRGSGGPSRGEIQAGVTKGRDRAIALLTGAADTLDEGAKYALPAVEEDAQPQVLSDEIFIVHGRDNAAKVEVQLVVERAGLVPVVLHEQANAGRTIIEKFEAHGAAAGFAVVVLTPDDIGGLAGSTMAQLHPRARQNVIGEMFWFAGKLGRGRVCALKKGQIELPSDFAGVAYADMDDRGAWKKELLKELSAAGYDVDWKKALA
jgi:predicted nucleotide-binding protein